MSETFTVVSWNLLADSYVKPEYCPHTPPHLLESGRRRAALVERFASYAGDVDFLCLQEIEPATFAVAAEQLGSAFDGRFAKKRGKPDGCAIFARRSLGAPTFSELVFGDGTGHVAIAVNVGDVGVATTHLKWQSADVPPEERLGRGELVELMDRWLKPGETWVVCGDLNADASSPVLAAAFARGLADAYAAMPHAFTANSNDQRKRIDYILHTRDLDASPVAIPPITDVTPLPSTSEPSDHLAIRAALTRRL